MRPNRITITCLSCGNPRTIKASKLGRARYCSRECADGSKRTTLATLLTRTVRNGDCLEFQGRRDPRGYGKVKHLKRSLRAHRLAYELAYGPIPEGLMILHSCDNPACINPEHLWLGDQQINMDDMKTKGRQSRGATHPSRIRPERVARGEQSGRAKLTEAQVLAIRARREAGEHIVPLAHEYGVSGVLISLIARRKIWKHLTQ